MDAKSLHENERSEMNLMDEEINDPDIEARLYAEIYYSNDTYPDINLEQEHQNDSQTADPKIPDNSLWCVDPQPGRSDTQYRQSFNVHDKSPQSAQYIKKTGFFPKRYRALIDGPIENQNNLRNRNRYDDWSPRNNSVRINRMDRINQHRGERQMKPPERRKKAPRSRLVIEEDDEPDRTSLTALDESLTIPAVQIPSRLEPIEPTPSSAPLASERIDENPEPPEVIDDNSKYKVVAKKLDENKRDPVDAAESDSDASIFEVPVPPKPAPPLISLKDSDEESSSSDEESPIVIDNDSSEQLKTSKKFSSSSSETSIIVDDSDDSNDSTVNVDTDNLIINCTSVQKGVGSIDEIRKIRGNDSNHTIIRQSDEESMTESEAMNWKSLEGKITRDKEVINPCEPQIEFWNELSDDSESRSNLLGNELLEKQSNNVNPIPSEKKTVNENEGIDKSTDETSPGNNKRIRGDGRDEIVEIDEPAPKKKKQKEPNREISFQEYLFQPMPKQMVAFYNNPRGGEMMRDIKEIQNKMPRNPNCWAILDDDMHPPGRRTRIVCALCQNEGHVRSKCPNRSKPPICHICGLTGHMEPRCPYNKQCINCGKKYGTCRKTCEMCNTLRCSQCSGKGHTMASCPDNWRKYHQTTTGERLINHGVWSTVMKPPSQLVCCNCCERGHEVSTCDNNIVTIHIDDSDDDEISILPWSKQNDIALLSDRSINSNNNQINSINELNDGTMNSDDDIVEIPYEKPPIPVYSISDDELSVKSSDNNYVRNILSQNNSIDEDLLDAGALNDDYELIDVTSNDFDTTLVDETSKNNNDPEQLDDSDGEDLDVVATDTEDDEEIIDVGTYDECFHTCEKNYPKILEIERLDDSIDESVKYVVESIIDRIEKSNIRNQIDLLIDAAKINASDSHNDDEKQTNDNSDINPSKNDEIDGVCDEKLIDTDKILKTETNCFENNENHVIEETNLINNFQSIDSSEIIDIDTDMIIYENILNSINKHSIVNNEDSDDVSNDTLCDILPNPFGISRIESHIKTEKQISSLKSINSSIINLKNEKNGHPLVSNVESEIIAERSNKFNDNSNDMRLNLKKELNDVKRENSFSELSDDDL